MANIPAHTSQVAYAGPVQVLTPPRSDSSASESQRKRLRQCNQSSSSEDSPLAAPPEPEIKCEDLRVGGPTLCRLPARFFPINPEDPLVGVYKSGLRERIMDAIETSRIDFEEMSVLRRRWKASRDPPSPVILITARRNGIDNTWFLLCQKIREICISAGQCDLDIEICDPLAYKPILSYVVGPRDRIVQLWPTLKVQILKVLDGKRWLALDVLRRGYEDSEPTVTIVLTIPECPTNDAFIWRSVRDRIVDIINAAGLDDVAVEVGRGAIYAYDRFEADLLDERDWSTKARFGGSLAPVNDTKRGGTFGGFVVLDFPDGKSKICGLTSFHCVVNDDTNNPERDRWEVHGIRPHDPKNDIKLSHPCRRDHDDMIDEYKKSLAKFQTPEHYQRLSLSNDPNELLIPSQQRKLANELECIADLENKIQRAEKFMQDGANYLGSLYAGSGFRLTEAKNSLDWALVDVEPARISSNKLSPTVVDMHAHFFPLVAGHVTKASFKLNVHMSVYKLGRSTGFTRGIVNGLETTRLRSWVLGGPSGDIPTQKCSEDRAIVCDDRHEFSSRGDSGALVLDEDGSVVGLLFGGNMLCTTTYITPTAVLFDDIKRITGACEVRVLDIEE